MLKKLFFFLGGWGGGSVLYREAIATLTLAMETFLFILLIKEPSVGYRAFSSFPLHGLTAFLSDRNLSGLIDV